MNNEFLKLRDGNIKAELHLNPELEIVFVKSGQVTVFYENAKEILNSGEAALIMPYHLHGFESENNTSANVLMFSFSLAEEMYNTYRAKSFCNRKFMLNPIEREYTEYALKQDISDINLVRSLFYMMIFSFLKNNDVYSEHNYNSQLITKIMKYIYLNFEKKVTLDILAKEFSINRNEICKLLNGYAGISLNKLLRSLRIEKAKGMLEKNGNNITEIAFSCGFGTTRTFNRAFQEHTGITPSEYRKQK